MSFATRLAKFGYFDPVTCAAECENAISFLYELVSEERLDPLDFPACCDAFQYPLAPDQSFESVWPGLLNHALFVTSVRTGNSMDPDISVLLSDLAVSVGLDASAGPREILAFFESGSEAVEMADASWVDRFPLGLDVSDPVLLKLMTILRLFYVRDLREASENMMRTSALFQSQHYQPDLDAAQGHTGR